MIAIPRIPLTHVWILGGIMAVILLYTLASFIQALRTPPDAWTETNRAKRRK